MFLEPPPELAIGPLSKLINEENPPKYKEKKYCNYAYCKATRFPSKLWSCQYLKLGVCEVECFVDIYIFIYESSFIQMFDSLVNEAVKNVPIILFLNQMVFRSRNLIEPLL